MHGGLRSAPLLAVFCGACGMLNGFDSGDVPEPPPPPPEDTAELCGDEIDNDGDGLVDCAGVACRAFDHCEEHTEPACSNGVDDDLDGRRDCDEQACQIHPDCQEASDAACSDGVDNDKDGAVDCYDPACKQFAPCLEDSPGSCQDGKDNDLNGLVDCVDPSCEATAPCQEAGEDNCSDGIDNDRDGDGDCVDVDCALTATCFPTVELTRDPACPTARQGTSFHDDFDDGIDPDTWSVFNTSPDDRPRTVGGRLNLSCTDNWYGSGLVSNQRFSVGRSQPFSLGFRVTVDGACNADPDRCRVFVHLHTRDRWADGIEGGQAVLTLQLRVADDGEALTVDCSYHGRQLDTLDDGRVQLDRSRSTDVQVQLDSQTGVIRFSFGQGQDVECESPPAEELEPEAALVFDEGCLPDQPGALLFDDVRMVVDGQQELESCVGLRENLLEDMYCGDAFWNDGTFRGEPLRMADEYLMPFVGHHDLNHNDIGIARSADGRHGWTLVSRSPVLDPHENAYLWSLGAAAHDADEGRLQAWVREAPASAADSSSLWHAPVDRLTEWTKVGGLLLDGEPVAPGREHPWMPDSVLREPDGTYVGWFTAVLAQGVQVIQRATSSDGLQWTSDELPALLPEVDGWDRESVYDPAVRRWDSFYVMAYAAQPFGADAGIGLAISKDGLGWTKHVSNPVVTAGEDDFDAGSLGHPVAQFDGEVVRVWYSGRSIRPRICRGQEHGNRQEIGLTELYLPTAP